MFDFVNTESSLIRLRFVNYMPTFNERTYYSNFVLSVSKNSGNEGLEIAAAPTKGT